ncbi:Thrombospondin type-1 (TSP1) repeat, partial [Trinorchestia longiramus]
MFSGLSRGVVGSVDPLQFFLWTWSPDQDKAALPPLQIITSDMWGGRRCPEVLQTRVCWGSCEGRWTTGGWGECEASNGAVLTVEGEGTQTQHISCTRVTEDGLEEEVDEEECRGLPRPSTTQPCRVTPPGECVVGPWSSWTLCSPGCVMHSSRNRSRVVLRQPVKAAGDAAAASASCPPLHETEPCLAGVSCWWYTWQVGNWTSCVPLGQSSCGEGVMNRPVACVRSDGMKVHERWCGEESKPTPRETWCYVDCPIDCEVSPWSSWQDSLCSCGDTPGNMTRHRYVTVNPSESGRVCPSQLHQHRPCPSVPCYTWERGPWGRCTLQGGTCGHGTVSRSVACVGPGGERVSPALCLQLFHVGGHSWPFLSHALDLNTQDSCLVSCEGGCELTEWSAWSHCHRDCTNGEASGVQTRTRGVLSPGVWGTECPHDLRQTRPCLTGPCRSYEWQFRDGEAICVRDDGVTVTSGCNETQRPCYPGCALPNSRCSVLGWCVCRAGYRAVYSEQHQYTLSRCVPHLDANGSLASLPLAQRLMQPRTVPRQCLVISLPPDVINVTFICTGQCPESSLPAD